MRRRIYPKDAIPENLQRYFAPAEMGLEASPAEYVAAMVGVFAEVRRVLADDGVLWLNIGDSYAQSGGHTSHGVTSQLRNRSVRSVQGVRNQIGDRPAKNLLGIPWRVAFALQDDGWTLRNSVIWSKPNAMPESVTDRLSTRYEHVFLFSKSRRYTFDLDAVREAHITADRVLVSAPRGSQAWSANSSIGSPQQASGTAGVGRHNDGRNPGDFWQFDEAPFEMPTGALTTEEAIYIASFIDGEGSICIRRRKTQIQMMLTVVNTHEGVIRWLHERTGMGQIKQREIRNERWRPIWEWSVTSRQAAQVIHAIYPHFRVKRQQAALALNFMASTRAAGGGIAPPEYHAERHAMAEDLAALNAGRITESRYAVEPTERPRTSSKGDVWTIPTSPFPGSHFACMPPELARRCILAGCPEDGTVLDPFAGSGTTLKVARSLGRNSIGIELNPGYIDIIRDRIGQSTLDFGSAS